MTEGFAGRVAAVTGAGSGLGRATAIGLAAQGARVLLFDRDAAGLAETASDCPGSLSFTGDVTDAAALAAAAAQCLTTLGPVGLLATAAGINGSFVDAVDMTEIEWDRLFDVNVKGTWLAIRAFLPQMRSLGRGAIVTFASSAGLQGSTALQAYSASKGAVVMLTRSLALAHAGENIRVNAVCPGSIETPLLEETLAAHGTGAARLARETAFRERHPLKRFGQAHEVAAAALFLLGDASAFTTGIAMPIDGGRLA